ncbi:hypothetical protein BDA96_01G136300 [Sorghum bicolor]|uniref:Uncharacterized protein n=2 Tax=Sorghum bicolor TaxID=4558 RepID=A0A921RX07_SORBI|nr:hypothetical protein SORBI_3001G130500 [Sorghum bicolor]KAG0548084.1 hypothetical protein BDA96_01G136300 [Sorghum bicolor]
MQLKKLLTQVGLRRAFKGFLRRVAGRCLAKRPSGSPLEHSLRREGVHRGLETEKLTCRHHGLAWLWVIVAAPVIGNIQLWSCSSIGLLGTYRSRCALALPEPISIVILLIYLFCLALKG